LLVGCVIRVLNKAAAVHIAHPVDASALGCIISILTYDPLRVDIVQRTAGREAAHERSPGITAAGHRSPSGWSSVSNSALISTCPVEQRSRSRPGVHGPQGTIACRAVA